MRRIVLLAAGASGAALAAGLASIIPPGQLTIITSTGADFIYHGLNVAPDIDALLHALSLRPCPPPGHAFMAGLASLGAASWYNLDGDSLALAVLRTASLGLGRPLSATTGDFARAWGIASIILPMSDRPVGIRLATEQGELDYPAYMAAAKPPFVSAIRHAGASYARPAPGVLEALSDEDTAAIIIAPSHPHTGIGPILAVPGIADVLSATTAPVVAISPVRQGALVEGSLLLLRELGLEPSPAAIAGHYVGMLDGMMLDEADAGQGLDLPTAAAPLLLDTPERAQALARAALGFAQALRNAF